MILQGIKREYRGGNTETPYEDHHDIFLFEEVRQTQVEHEYEPRSCQSILGADQWHGRADARDDHPKEVEPYDDSEWFFQYSVVECSSGEQLKNDANEEEENNRFCRYTHTNTSTNILDRYTQWSGKCQKVEQVLGAVEKKVKYNRDRG